MAQAAPKEESNKEGNEAIEPSSQEDAEDSWWKQNLLPQMKTSREVHICLYIAFLYPPDNVRSYNYHVMLLLVNVMSPS